MELAEQWNAEKLNRLGVRAKVGRYGAWLEIEFLQKCMFMIEEETIVFCKGFGPEGGVTRVGKNVAVLGADWVNGLREPLRDAEYVNYAV